MSGKNELVDIERFISSTLMLRPCSSVVEQYPEKVCVVSAILTKATTN